MIRRGVTLAVLSLLFVAPRIAAADERGREADRLFDEGKELSARGNFAAACSRFEASIALQPGIGARLWLADCYEGLGRTASAQRQFRVAAEDARKAGDKRAQIADKRALLLESRIVKIEIDVKTPIPDERIDVDGVATTSDATLAVDPGRHLVTARAPGYAPWTLSFDAVSPEHVVTVVVPELSRSVPSPPSPSPHAKAVSSAPASRWTSGRTAGVVTGAVGAAGLAASAVLAILAVRDHDQSKRGCDVTCTQDAHDVGERAVHEANAATLALLLGTAFTATGAGLFFLSPRSPVSVAPTARGASLRVVF